MHMKFFLLAWWLGCALTGFARAAATTGTINATLTLTNGCLINGDPATANASFGTLDFGTHPATFDTLSATLTGATGDGIRVRCTDGATYSVQIIGSNTAPTNVYGAETASPRYLVLGSDASQGIAYTLYNDAAFTTPIANNTRLRASGIPDPVNGNIYPVYGRVSQGGNNTAVPAGTYTDVINVQVIY
ncbi:Csu type fimbrial protein [Acerihabitans arboris]|uniref:Fimbrial major subunit CsuA/B family protein n=1 Tax=Acerihabitans arboris TaxID=2691583 RepID=A0A845SUH0_9GAMM|nr:spore coat U domain-containing protein [Acerihabitans arboris]NDL64655.1 fimbrial major subunit CsuA/B family protein [Acerihabitans arboris]